MRRTFIILALAALSAHAVDCIRPMFEYFASHYRTEVLNLYILPGRMNPDSLHQQQNIKPLPNMPCHDFGAIFSCLLFRHFH